MILMTTENKKTIKGVRGAIYNLIAEGKYSKQQIIDIICKDWANVKAITVSTYLSDAKNPKYTKAEKIAVEDPKTKIFMFSK
jgi:hypothetical protein